MPLRGPSRPRSKKWGAQYAKRCSICCPGDLEVGGGGGPVPPSGGEEGTPQELD
jgi:hypothetical protein